MKAKKILKKILPHSLYAQLKRVRNSERVETLKLKAEGKIKLDSCQLYYVDDINIPDIFNNKNIWEAWEAYENKIKTLQIPDLTGGVNVGDRKALFFIMCYFKPKSVLEVGTHIGASTVHIASALNYNKQAQDVDSSFSTLDIRDVNCRSEKPWLKFESPKSPQELIEDLKLDVSVRFMSQDSLNYFESTEHSYDMIFLDGDHSARTVYKEVPQAVKRLNKGGIILLHDYFKFGDSANPNNKFNSGPYLAIQRHINEGAKIEVKTFGKLPWKTKYDSNITSLALLLKT